MQSAVFNHPVTILVGMGYPREIRSVFEAYQFLWIGRATHRSSVLRSELARRRWLATSIPRLLAASSWHSLKRRTCFCPSLSSEISSITTRVLKVLEFDVALRAINCGVAKYGSALKPDRESLSSEPTGVLEALPTFPHARRVPRRGG